MRRSRIDEEARINELKMKLQACPLVRVNKVDTGQLHYLFLLKSLRKWLI